ncbi:MAG: response regulator, partial [Fibrobacterota bacterium]
MTDSVHILLTDDESGLRTAMGRVLARSGHVVEVATTGLEALEMIVAAESAENPFDLLITDVNMPQMRGDVLVSNLRSRGCDIEILVISGFGDKALVVDLMRMGVEHYMDKPFSANEFQDTVAKICGQIQMKRLAATRSRDLEGQVASLATDLVRYRRGFDEMRVQMEHAVRSYQSLMNLPQQVPGLEFESRIRPLHDLGGDYLGINTLKDGVEILLADVAGHDMGASYVTILLKSFFENNKDVKADGERFFHVLNSGLIEL